MKPNVTIVQQGRESQVIYREGPNAIAGYQEFGGDDVVAIVSMGSLDDWRARHAWAVDRRREILRFVADEVIRQRAPSCSATIDEAGGAILLRSSGVPAVASLPRSGVATRTTAGSPAGSHAWVLRYSSLKAWLGAAVLIAALAVGAVMWVKSRVFAIDPGKGTPFGSTLRTDAHLATLIDQLQPYTPSLHRDPSKDRRSLGLFLVPLDGSTPNLVPLVSDLQPGSYSLARVFGSDGRRMWVDANGLIGVDLRTGERVTERDVARVNPRLDPQLIADTRGIDLVDGRLQLMARDRSAAWALNPETLAAAPVQPQVVARRLSNPPLTTFMAAGLITENGNWLGLQSTADLSGGYRAGRWLRPIESASDTARETRRLMRGDLGPASSGETHRQIRGLTPIDDTEYRNASFLRLAEKWPPLRVAGPDSVLMLHTSRDGAPTAGTLLVSRVQVDSGRLLWSADTGIDRFKLSQILPAEHSTAFVGTRPPIPDKVSEPLLVMLDHSTGRLTTLSLWQ